MSSHKSHVIFFFNPTTTPLNTWSVKVHPKGHKQGYVELLNNGELYLIYLSPEKVYFLKPIQQWFCPNENINNLDKEVEERTVFGMSRMTN